MWYDDYVGVIGSFCWYMYERIGGFEQSREEHPSYKGAAASQGKAILDDWGGVINSGPVKHGPIRLADLYKIATKHTDKPVKVSVGAGPANLAWHVYFQHYKNAKELSFALAPIFNKEMKDLVAAGAKYLQFEDLGAWLPLFSNNKDDYKWIREIVEMCCDGVDAKIGWHFCFGNAWGNDILSENFPEGYQTVLPYFFGTPGIDEFVLDYANRDMAGVEFLKKLPDEPGRADRRARHPHEQPSRNRSRSPTVSAARSSTCRAEKVTLSTDCGMKPLARMVVADEAQGARRRRRDRPQGDQSLGRRDALATRTSGPAPSRAGPFFWRPI